MKIAILAQIYLPRHVGGVEIATYNIARHLSAKGHQVHVLTLQDEGLPAQSQEEGFFVHRLKLPRIKSLGVLIFWLNINRTIKKIKPDMLHVQGTTMAMPAYIAKKLFGIPYVIQGHGFDIYFSWKFKKVISRTVLKNAKAVIAQTESMKLEMQKSFSRDVFIVPNGIDFSKFVSSQKRDEVRKKLRISETETVVVFAGKLRPVKGAEFLIRAMQLVVRANPAVKLILLGGGELQERLQELAKQLDLEQQVVFIGQLPHEEMPGYLAAADIFVLPSLSEGFSLISLEAMASGLPVIATRVGVLPEIIENGINGFLVDPGKPGEIATEVIKISLHKKLRDGLSLNNREKAKAYDWPGIIQKLENIYCGKTEAD